MILKGEALAAHLDGNRPLASLYVLYGDEPLLVIEASDAIRAAARQRGFTERDVLTVLPGFNWGELFTRGGNLSLFGDKSLLDLRIPSGKPGRDGSEALQRYCGQLSSDSLMLVTLPELNWQDEKSAWFTALEKAGVAIKLNAPRLDELPAWIGGRLARQQQRASREALHFLAERVEGNLLAAHQEIQKLALLYPTGREAPELTLEQVKDAVLDVARYDLDSLREALLAGDTGRMARILDALRQSGEALPLVIWAVTEEVRALATLAQGVAAGRPLDALLKEARVWGPRQGALKQALGRLRDDRPARALKQVARVDRIAKGIEDGDAWLELLRLGMGLGSGSAGRNARNAGGRPGLR